MHSAIGSLQVLLDLLQLQVLGHGFDLALPLILLHILVLHGVALVLHQQLLVILTASSVLKCIE